MSSLLAWVERNRTRVWIATIGASLLLVVAQFVELALRFDGAFFVLFPRLTMNPLTWLTVFGLLLTAYPWIAAALLLIPTCVLVLKVSAMNARGSVG